MFFGLFKRKRKPPPLPVVSPHINPLDAKIAILEAQLRAEVSQTEKLYRASYIEWKIGYEKRKQIFITKGVLIPRSPWQEEQDQSFIDMERRLEEQRQRFLAAERAREEDANRQAEIERRTAQAVALIQGLDNDLK